MSHVLATWPDAATRFDARLARTALRRVRTASKMYGLSRLLILNSTSDR